LNSRRPAGKLEVAARAYAFDREGNIELREVPEEERDGLRPFLYAEIIRVLRVVLPFARGIRTEFPCVDGADGVGVFFVDNPAVVVDVALEHRGWNVIDDARPAGERVIFESRGYRALLSPVTVVGVLVEVKEGELHKGDRDLSVRVAPLKRESESDTADFALSARPFQVDLAEGVHTATTPTAAAFGAVCQVYLPHVIRRVRFRAV